MSTPAGAEPPPAPPAPAPGGATPPAPPAPPPAAHTPPAGPPAADPGEPNWLPQRLGRERAAVLKDAGFESVEAAKQAKVELDQLKAAQEQTRLAQLSETEREKEKAKKLEADLATEKARYKTLERQNSLSTACAQLGVKNVGYAGFLFEQAIGADPNITATAALTAALADEQNRAALGAGPVRTVPVPTGDTTPPGTAPVPGGVAPVPGGPNGFDASKATPADWATYKASIGL